MTTRGWLHEALAAYGGDPARLLDDAKLGKKIREKNRAAARRPREREDDPDFRDRVIALRAAGLSCPRIADRLLSAFASDIARDPVTALTRRVERCLRRARAEQRLTSPALRCSANVAP